MADDLRDIIDLAKRELPDMPPEMWSRFERIIRANFGASRVYIAAQKKGRHLAAMEAAGDVDAARMSEVLGVTVRRVRQLRKLR